MFSWVASFFGFQSVKAPLPQESKGSNTSRALYLGSTISLGQMGWPEGPQRRQHIRYHEPDGWAHSNWSWHSSGYVDRSESLHPKLGKAETRHCLGVLKCRGCGNLIRPSTKTKDMRAQLERDCPNLTCAEKLELITCEARTLHLVTEEDGIQYSVWEHIGSHCSHPRPPQGRRPPRSVPMPPPAMRTAGTSTGAHKINAFDAGRPCRVEVPIAKPKNKTVSFEEVSPKPRRVKVPKATLKNKTVSFEEASPANVQSPGTSTITEFAEKMQSQLVDSGGVSAWRDEMYLIHVFLVVGQPLTRVLALGNMHYSEWFQKAYSILPGSFHEMEPKSCWNGTLATSTVLDTCQLHRVSLAPHKNASMLSSMPY